MKVKRIILYIFILLVVTACSALVSMSSEKMDKLELEMSKEQVISILGTGYTIAEKRIDNGIEIEILSYRDSYQPSEIYLFKFENGKLKEWYREILPKYEVTTN